MSVKRPSLSVQEKIELLGELIEEPCEHGCHYNRDMRYLSLLMDCPKHGKHVGGRHLSVVKEQS